MPGYGFSGKPTETGWDPERIGRAWATLMERLGYQRYVAQGGDWGALIVDLMGVQAVSGLIGIHTNMAGALPPEIDAAASAGTAPSGLDDEEKRALDQVSFFYKYGLGYAIEMGNRPQTLYGLEDSPIALAAWIIDHDIWSYKLIARVFDGADEGLTRDDILDNITLYWLTSTGVSARSPVLGATQLERQVCLLRSEAGHHPGRGEQFPGRARPNPAEMGRKSLSQFGLLQSHLEGGHFAAWEKPQAITEDMRAGFRSLR